MRATDQLAAMEMMAVDPLPLPTSLRRASSLALPPCCCWYAIFNAMAIPARNAVCVSWLASTAARSGRSRPRAPTSDRRRQRRSKSVAFGAVCTLIATFNG